MSLKDLIAAAVLSTLASSAWAEEPKIVVMEPYARTSTPSSKSGAIFLDVVNSGGPDRLIAASTPVAKTTMLHSHREDADGVMRMIHIEDGWEVPADGVLMLDRGGKHVMLMGLTKPLEQGDTLPLTLTFEQAGEVTIDVVIDHKRKPGGTHGGHSHGG